MRNFCFLVTLALSFSVCGQSYVVYGSRLDGAYDNFSGTALDSQRHIATNMPPIFAGSYYFEDSFKKGIVIDNNTAGANPVECYLI
jgi:hypothetical protein